MKISLPIFALFALAGAAHAQSFTEGFNDLGSGGDDFNISALQARGWAETNNSTSPSGFGPYANGQSSVFASHSGAGYTSVNYAVGGATLSAWLFTPSVTLNNGDTFSFWTRTTSGTFPDRLELRLSTSGTSTNVGATATSTGDYGTLLTSVNPNETTTGYPTTWTQYTATVAGITNGTSGRFAFRYFVDNTSVNGDYIGIDDVAYTAAPVPEPATMAVLGLGALGLVRRRRNK